MPSIDLLRSIVGRMRYVKTGDFLLADDHNSLVDYAKAATDALADHEARITDLENRVSTLESRVSDLEAAVSSLQVTAAAAAPAEPFTSSIELAYAIMLSARLATYNRILMTVNLYSYAINDGPLRAVDARFPSFCRALGFHKLDTVRSVLDAVVQDAQSANAYREYYNNVDWHYPWLATSGGANGGLVVATLPVTSDAVSLAQALRDAYPDYTVSVSSWLEAVLDGMDVLIVIHYNADGTASVEARLGTTGTPRTMPLDPSTEHILVIGRADFNNDGQAEVRVYLLAPDGTVESYVELASGLTTSIQEVDVTFTGCGVWCDPSTKDLGADIATIDKVAVVGLL